jgi:hypothetical protein
MITCPCCGGGSRRIGWLGKAAWYVCRACGVSFSTTKDVCSLCGVEGGDHMAACLSLNPDCD